MMRIFNVITALLAGACMIHGVITENWGEATFFLIVVLSAGMMREKEKSK
jgi:hypothetical protein